jgi:transcriptional regulator with XRE-family HTH domain
MSAARSAQRGSGQDRPASVGGRLKAARKATGMTQTKAAEALGVTRRSIYEWETDERVPMAHLPELAQLYGVPVTMLLYGVEPASEELAALREMINQLATQLEGLHLDVRVLVESTGEGFSILRDLLTPNEGD